MPGSFDFGPDQGTDLELDAIQIQVFLYDPEAGEQTLIPNIRCEQIQYKEGVDPPTARFSYILDEIAALGHQDPDDPEGEIWPTQFEQIWPIEIEPTQYIVGNGDELVVKATIPGGQGNYSEILGGPDPLSGGDAQSYILFHGLARVPQTDVSGGNQHVTFVAAGIAIRMWELPVAGSRWRDGDNIQSNTYVDIDAPARFNPSGTGQRAVGGLLPNCTPDDWDLNEGEDNAYPLFLDPAIDLNPDVRTFWTLNKVCRYLLSVCNPDELKSDPTWHQFIQNPNFDDLQNLLDNRRPKSDTGTFNPGDPSTYTSDPIIIKDFDCTNMAWPEALERMLGYHGFGMRWKPTLMDSRTIRSRSTAKTRVILRPQSHCSFPSREARSILRIRMSAR